MTPQDPSVFIVDDDASVRRSLERLVRTAGYPVRSFPSAQQFLERGDLDAAGCLVVDMRMPGQSGVDLHEELQASGHHIPVIFITGDGDGPIAERAVRAGAVAVLAKPFDGQALLDAVQRAISSRVRA
jgi:FixJ family two-component response regulator